MEDIWLCLVTIVFTIIFKTGRGTIVAIGDNHFVLNKQCSNLPALAIGIFGPDRCHPEVSLIKLKLLFIHKYSDIFKNLSRKMISAKVRVQPIC
jgi:hypothetical protein